MRMASRWLLRSVRTGPSLALVLALASGCGPGGTLRNEEKTDDPSSRLSGGMVVSGSGPATAAGIGVLRAGGNAVDAAVATAFALAVTEPTQSGLGGRTQALVRQPDGAVFGVDATTEVPAGYDAATAPRGEFGWGAVGIPGSVAGLASLHRQAGRLAWSDLLEPAIRLAEEGFELSAGEAERLASAAVELRESEGGRQFLGREGAPLAPGQWWVQPRLARTLRRISETGPEDFYEGEIARTLAMEVAEGGGSVSPTDLAAYRPRPAIVVRGRYRDLELVGTYLPASGHTTIEALQILDRFELDAMTPDRWTATVGLALLTAFQDREDATGPAEADAERLTSPAWASERAEGIRGVLDAGVTAGVVAASPGWGTTGDRAVDADRGPLPRSRSGQTTSLSREDRVGRLESDPPNTTHLVVVDGEGMAVSMTQSLGPTGGARVASAALGFLLASTMGYLEDVRPGDRPWSSQSPMILSRDGELAYLIGGGGSRRIISGIVQTVARLASGVELAEALAAPRFHPGDELFLLESVPDSDWHERAAQGPEALGFNVEVQPSGVYFARLNAIAVDPATGKVTGVGDPRWPESMAAGTEGPVKPVALGESAPPGAAHPAPRP